MLRDTAAEAPSLTNYNLQVLEMVRSSLGKHTDENYKIARAHPHFQASLAFLVAACVEVLVRFCQWTDGAKMGQQEC